MTPRETLWAEGLPILIRLTGVNERRARAHLGRMLKDLRDDAEAATGILRDAARLDPAQATAWIAAAVKAHGKPAAVSPLARARAAQLARRAAS